MDYTLDYIEQLENESIFILREVLYQFKNPALLFSGGKDSTVLIHLAKRAFWPNPIPFKILHIDTGHNFSEVIDFRDQLVKDLELKLIIASVEDSIRKGSVTDSDSRNALQSVTLMEAIHHYQFDALIGGARRDEEKSRAKERIFSLRDKNGMWNSHHQRPELWNLFNGFCRSDEHFRIFPLSNWTELDIWNYIQFRKLEVSSLYYSHPREVFLRDGQLLTYHPLLKPTANDKKFIESIRYRTIGDITCSSALKSDAKTIDEIIKENTLSHYSERGTRLDDKVSLNSMEDRKKQGYF